MEIPHKALEDKAALSSIPKPSDIRIKRKWEIGFPFPSPQDRVKVDEGIPLTRIE